MTQNWDEPPNLTNLRISNKIESDLEQEIREERMHEAREEEYIKRKLYEEEHED